MADFDIEVQDIPASTVRSVEGKRLTVYLNQGMKLSDKAILQQINKTVPSGLSAVIVIELSVAAINDFQMSPLPDDTIENL